jgi:hypothetical protein
MHGVILLDFALPTVCIYIIFHFLLYVFFRRQSLMRNDECASFESKHWSLPSVPPPLSSSLKRPPLAPLRAPPSPNKSWRTSPSIPAPITSPASISEPFSQLLSSALSYRDILFEEEGIIDPNPSADSLTSRNISVPVVPNTPLLATIRQQAFELRHQFGALCLDREDRDDLVDSAGKDESSSRNDISLNMEGNNSDLTSLSSKVSLLSASLSSLTPPPPLSSVFPALLTEQPQPSPWTEAELAAALETALAALKVIALSHSPLLSQGLYKMVMDLDAEVLSAMPSDGAELHFPAQDLTTRIVDNSTVVSFITPENANTARNVSIETAETKIEHYSRRLRSRHALPVSVPPQKPPLHPVLARTGEMVLASLKW